MPIKSITYNTVTESIKNWIKTNSINIANWNSIPTCFKQGYSNTYQIAGNETINSNCTATIVKYITQSTTNAVDTDFNTFLTYLNIKNNLNSQLPGSEFINFINNIINFCSIKLCFVVSQFSENSYLIYNQNANLQNIFIQQNTYNSTKKISNEDMLKMLNCLENDIKKNIRTISCTYTFTLS